MAAGTAGTEPVERFELHMSDADALMWNIEKDPLLRSTIVTVLLLDRSPNWSALLARVDRGTRLIPRMRQRVATPLLRMGPPHWSADPNFDLHYHVRRVRASEPSTEALLDIARTAAMAGFDRARPLWEYTLVEGLEDGRAAMVIKVHHSLTDGVGGMKLLMMLFDFALDAPDPEPVADGEPLPILGAIDLVTRSLAHRRRRALGIVRRAVTDSVGVAQALLRDPLGTASQGAHVASSIARYLAPATVPRSPMLRQRTLARRLGTFDVDLDAMKRAARSVNSSLNDAFVAAVVGGVQRYHQFHGEPVDELRMVMPINVRPEDAALGGNHFTPARFVVPADIKDPVERMAEMGRLSRWIRDEPAVALTDALAGILNLLPTTVTTAVFGAMLKGADLVTSNVPGAPIPLYVGGARVERMYAFAPLAGAALNVTLLSHCGTCCIGVNVDAVAIPDLESFLRCLQESFDEVLALA
jgi:WS/DGAT/MGAT family acyltransferase